MSLVIFLISHKKNCCRLPNWLGSLAAEISGMQELFLLVIQDKKIQRLMDELDLPPDRANLCPGSINCVVVYCEVGWG